jgi:hypothetical protein
VDFSLRYQSVASVPNGPGFSGATAQPANVGSSGDPGYSAQAIANWSVILRRPFKGVIGVGIVAAHMNGIDRVEVSANGGAWKAIRSPIYTAWDGLSASQWATTTAESGEYVALLRAADFPDGLVELRARVYPKSAGMPRVLQGGGVAGVQDEPDNSLFMLANSGGTYDGTDYYVSPTGNDSNDGLSTGAPFATVLKALAVGTDCARVNLMAGTHVLGQRVSGFNHNLGFITIQPAPGVSAASIVLQPVAGNLMDLRTDYLCFKGLNIDATFRARRMLNTVWYRDCVVTGDIPPTDASTTSNTIGTGAKTFTIGTGLDYIAADPIVVSHDANNYFVGTVTSYNSGTGSLVINATDFGGSGTFISWTVQLNGDGLEWCNGDDWFTGMTIDTLFRETALLVPKLARGVSISGSRENAILDPKVLIDVDVTDLLDFGHADNVQWAGASSNCILYRVRANVGVGIPQTYFADQQMSDVAILSCVGTSDGANELIPGSGNQFGKGSPARNINHLVIQGCTFHSFCIYASEADADSSNMVIRATAAAKFGSDVAGIVTVEGCHAFASSAGFPGTLTEVGSNTSGDDTMSTALNADLTPKAALQNRMARVLVATDAAGNQRTQQDVGAYAA